MITRVGMPEAPPARLAAATRLGADFWEMTDSCLIVGAIRVDNAPQRGMRERRCVPSARAEEDLAMHLRFLSLQLFLELGLLAPPTGAAPMLTGLGDLQGGIFGSWANAISADGFTVVGSGTSTAGVEAFLVTVPEPPTGALRVGTLLTMGLLSLMSLQRSKAP